MNVNEMTRKQFEELEHREWDKEIVCSGLVIIPGRASNMHDSGYRCMDLVAVDGDKAVCLLAGGSDVIHVDGIGGYGDNWLEKYKTIPSMTPPISWSMDCLPKSGLLRMWAAGHKLRIPPAHSSFEMLAFKVEEDDDE
jgi:hypothetical protein